MDRFANPPDVAVTIPGSAWDEERWQPDEESGALWRNRTREAIDRLPDSVKILEFFSQVWIPNRAQANRSGSMPIIHEGRVTYVPKYPDDMAEVTAYAQERGLKVIAYFNAFRFTRLHDRTMHADHDRRNPTAGAKQAAMAAVLARRDMGHDGIYLDGPLPAGTWYALEHPDRVAAFYRDLRRAWPDAVILQHASGFAEVPEFAKYVDIFFFGEHGDPSYSPYPDTMGSFKGMWNVIDNPDHPQYAGFRDRLREIGVWPLSKMSSLHRRGDNAGPEGLRSDYPQGWWLPSDWDRENAKHGIIRKYITNRRGPHSVDGLRQLSESRAGFSGAVDIPNPVKNFEHF